MTSIESSTADIVADSLADSRANSRELAHSLAAMEPVDLEPWHGELLAATRDLVAAANLGWSIEPEESTVALTRTIVHLAGVSPTATSALAAHLIDALNLAEEN